MSKDTNESSEVYVKGLGWIPFDKYTNGIVMDIRGPVSVFLGVFPVRGWSIGQKLQQKILTFLEADPSGTGILAGIVFDGVNFKDDEEVARGLEILDGIRGPYEDGASFALSLHEDLGTDLGELENYIDWERYAKDLEVGGDYLFKRIDFRDTRNMSKWGMWVIEGNGR